MHLLEAKHVTKKYAAHTALNDVSIEVPEGQIYGLLGPNGAGKTSLIRIINQITAPDQGEIMFNGERLSAEHISQIGYLPEERGLYKKMKVGEQAMYLAQLKGLPKNEALSKLKEWFLKFGIQDWWDKKVEELSKGMQQKVQFIVTVLHQPRLLIFDEPFSGFDPINVNLLKSEILEMQKKGATIIFSTHNMASVEELCDHIALINKSRKILDGSVVNIKNDFKKNIYEILFEKDETNLKNILPDSFELLEEQDYDRQLREAKIKLPTNAASKELLDILIKNIDIKGFKEILPSMNDIFIETVENYNAENI